MSKHKDILFIVPNQRLMLYRHIIRTTLWAVESSATYDVVSGDQFAAMYGEMPVSEAASALQAKYVSIGNFGDLSKREQKAYDKILAALQAHVAETQVAT